MFASATYPNQYFGESQVVYDPDDLKDQKLLILWGGEDIATLLYDERPVFSDGGYNLSDRDRLEVQLIEKAVNLGMPILGVCRGAQLLCAVSGGKLWQHVDHHEGKDHQLKVKMGGIEYLGYTNSFHHQMMRPPKDAEVLGISPTILSPFKCSEVRQESNEPEVEVAWYPDLRALAVQGHPEWLPHNSFLTRVTHELLKEKANVDLHNRR